MKNILMSFFLLLFSNLLQANSQNELSVIEKFSELEATSEGRLGVFAINTATYDVIEYRSHEVFPTGCTSKVIGVSAVLKKSMSDPSLLTTNILYLNWQLSEWSPITKQYVNIGMTIQDLCAASISFSDNTAMNLLLPVIGGIQGMNEFARSIGDVSFRQDNDWPKEAFSGGVNNLEDTSTPQSMVESFHKLTIGEVLDKPQKELLLTWLINSQTGASRIRTGIPPDWIVGNKTGTGATYGTTNDLAIVWPPQHAPILIGIYYTSHLENAQKREDIVANAARILIKEFMNKEKIENTPISKNVSD